MAEDLITEFMHEAGSRSAICHSECSKTLETDRADRGSPAWASMTCCWHQPVLREGLEYPECGLVAILDADKEGFLRKAKRSLIPRPDLASAARNVDGRVILVWRPDAIGWNRAISGEPDRGAAKKTGWNIISSTISRRSRSRKIIGDIIAPLHGQGYGHRPRLNRRQQPSRRP